MALATVPNWALDILALLLHLVSVSRLFMNETNANSMPSASMQRGLVSAKQAHGGQIQPADRLTVAAHSSSTKPRGAPSDAKRKAICHKQFRAI
jgi:hypothetical protein